MDMPVPALRCLLVEMPKAELHLHLDGSLRSDTALGLGRSRGVEAPQTWAEMYAALVAPMPCRDQAELLRAAAPDSGLPGPAYHSTV